MKNDIHPKFYNDIKVNCGCGNVFTTGSTVEKLSVEICSKCHPFFTGTQKTLDIEGRIDKFVKRQQQAQAKPTKKGAKEEKTANKSPKSLKELLAENKEE